MEQKDIIIKGARVHNLKNIDLTIPRNSFTVISGLSGSGKSSIAFDTLYSEGQRRYVESLSAYARQFLGLMEKPDVDSIEGLSPAISIEQKTGGHNPRSTVATITEIHDYFRLLYGSIGKPHCYNCGKTITNQTVQEICDTILAWEAGTKIQILSPIIIGKKGEHIDILKHLRESGFVRAMINGEMKMLDEEITLNKQQKHTIEVVIDRLVVKADLGHRLTDSVETALKNSCNGTLIIDKSVERVLFSEKLACADCGISYGEILPRNFSFNTPYGACQNCSGLGFVNDFDLDLVITSKKNQLVHSIATWSGLSYAASYNRQIFVALCENFGINPKTSWNDLSEEHQKIILYGSGNKNIKTSWSNKPFEGVIPNMHRRYKETDSEQVREWLETFMIQKSCPECGGQRLNKESLSVFVCKTNIGDLTHKSVDDAKKFFDNLDLDERDLFISKQILREINSRLGFLVNVGLGYLTLDRMAQTLSGGEAQRIRLATQIGSRLTGVTYILDEPSIGLHPRDNSKLLSTLLSLRDLGNTVVVVEHDEETLKAADYLIDMGPRAGKNGGEVVAAGTPAEVMANPNSLTGGYLSGRLKMNIPENRRLGNGNFLKIIDASGNNLKNVTAEIPLGTLTVITGVSGSGKSTLINRTLSPALSKFFYKTKENPLKHEKIEGMNFLDKVINIDQSPIGRTPRSNPATYTKLFDQIRDLYGTLPESKIRGYDKGRFSFNVKGGRCEACGGDGVSKIEMHFLPDVFVECDECRGKRYNRDTLAIKFKEKSIADILAMTVDEAVEFFHALPSLRKKVEVLSRVGLGYIQLGQSATTLSGGEAQRIKLAAELNRPATGKTIYILDEPTTGLHFEDVKMLMSVLQELVNLGNSVVIIEHNLDVIRSADWIIDLGPEGGEKGGRIIAVGTPEDVAKNSESETGKYLK
jgi:excinuclease ABC subunit A